MCETNNVIQKKRLVQVIAAKGTKLLQAVAPVLVFTHRKHLYKRRVSAEYFCLSYKTPFSAS